MSLKKNNGFTLVELMTAAYILLVGICGILLLLVNAMSSTEIAKNVTIATSHAEYVLEAMQNEKSLADITAKDWGEWAGQQKFDLLPEESFDISFEDPAKDPLEIEVTVEWMYKGGTQNTTLRTVLTK